MGYKSPSQIARRLTEDWASRNLYCPSCDANQLIQLKENTKVFDFECNQCKELYQFKSQNKSLGNKIVDSAYQPMIESIKTNKAPHLFILNYHPCCKNPKITLLKIILGKSKYYLYRRFFHSFRISSNSSKAS